MFACPEPLNSSCPGRDRLFEADYAPDRTTIIVVKGQDGGAYRLETYQGDL